MKYQVKGRTVVIPDNEIDKLIDTLGLSQIEAIDLWLADNNIEENEEQKELDKTASKVKILKDIEPKNAKKPRKPIERKISDEKKELFSEILSDLEDVYKENVTVLNENKLIEVKIGDKTFKIDVIEQRKPKKV